jgi:hypothetical protein
MTPKKLHEPFLMRFSEPIRRTEIPPARYDTARSVSQVLVDGNWVDAPEAFGTGDCPTRITEIENETTDDQ